jgi:multidrug efflux pump subunit AcrB
MGKGCKVALIVFGIIVVLVIAAIIVGFFYCNDIGKAFVTKMADTVEAKVLADLPPGANEDQVKQTFKDFRNAVDRGALSRPGSKQKLQILGEQVKDALEDKQIDSTELDRIMETMRDISKSVN